MRESKALPKTRKKAPETRPPESSGRVDKLLMEAVGAQVKTMRQAMKLTASEVAQAAGLSVAMLSKIENGQTAPSLATLQALAIALNVPITALFTKFDQKRDATFVKAGQGLVIERRGTRAGHRYELLGHSVHAPVKIEPFMITLDKKSDAYPIFQHAGYEFIYMLSGEVTYRHGDRSYLLQPGDSLFFDSEAPHGPEELRRLPARYLSIIVSMP
jgi:transcriptional regulator with XRE-family HTH domain